MSNRNRVTFELDIAPGTVIRGRYELQALIGEGGFAAVFEAFDRNIERKVAVKVLDVGLLPSDEKLRNKLLDRFRREASLAGRIKHPGVVGIYDYGLIDEQTEHPFIVMERLEGWDLEEQIFERGPLAPERALPLFIRGLEALGEAHEKGIVHRDLKPSNIFLANPGEASESLRIVDFGVAFMENAARGRLTQTGEILGTPNYLPPEYINDQIATPALDVYQMALILLELLSGRRVVSGKTAMRCIYTHITGELEVPQALAESALGRIVVTALAMDHERRFANGKAFANALRTVDPSSIPRLPQGDIPFVQPLLSTSNEPGVETESLDQRDREDSGQTLLGLGEIEDFDTERFLTRVRETGALSAKQTSRLIELDTAFEDERPDTAQAGGQTHVAPERPQTDPMRSGPTTEGLGGPTDDSQMSGPQSGLEARAPSMWEFTGDAFIDEESDALSQSAIQTQPERSSGVPLALLLVATILMLGLGGAFAYVYIGSDSQVDAATQAPTEPIAPAEETSELETAPEAEAQAKETAAGLADAVGESANTLASRVLRDARDVAEQARAEPKAERPEPTPEPRERSARTKKKRESSKPSPGKSLWVGVDSNPPGAIVTAEGKLVGRTPCKVKFEPDEKTQPVRFDKDGYELLDIELARDDYPSRRVILNPAD
ncbi:MAG: serine/threonine-protein kinase [Myxococcota bacterium]